MLFIKKSHFRFKFVFLSIFLIALNGNTAYFVILCDITVNCCLPTIINNHLFWPIRKLWRLCLLSCDFFPSVVSTSVS